MANKKKAASSAPPAASKQATPVQALPPQPDRRRILQGVAALAVLGLSGGGLMALNSGKKATEPRPGTEASAANISASGWRIQGTLTEACTCAAPCGCNFGQGPSPHHYCWAMFAYGIREGHYKGVKLDGLNIGAGSADKGLVFYLDERATPEQAEGLKAIVHRICDTLKPEVGEIDPSLKLRAIKTATVEQVVGEKDCSLSIEGAGEFRADYLLGLDDKTPIIVENNWSWNIQHCIKGVASRMRYKDEAGNQFDVKKVNANIGQFDYDENTKIFLR